jgi:hypothetical protein
MYNQEFVFDQGPRKGGDLADGVVEPYLGDEDTLFNFSVKYVGSESNENIRVFVNFTDVNGNDLRNMSLKYADGLYYNETLIEEDVGWYYFSIYSNDTEEWKKTNTGMGPITIPYSDMLLVWLVQGPLLTFITSGIMFYLIIFMYLWSKKTKEDSKRIQEEMKAKKEEEKEDKKEEDEKESEKAPEEVDRFVCGDCGAVVDADDEECWKCGEALEEEEND